MKYKKLLLFVTLSSLSLSCVKEIVSEQPVAAEGISEITASFADGQTKTVLGSDEKTILWSPNDEISVFYGTSRMKFTSINTQPDEMTIFASSQALVFGETESSTSRYLWAVYPYSSDNTSDKSSVTLNVPAIQTAVAGSFARGAFPSVGRSKDTNIAFYNVCGGVCFSLTQPDVQYITFSGNNNETIAGKVKVQFNGNGVPEVTEVVSGSTSIRLNAPTSAGFEVGKLYYFSVLPQNMSNGFTMVFNKAFSHAVRNSTSSVNIKRSIFGKISNADQGLEYVVSTYTDLSSAGFANCYVVSKAGNYKFNATVKGGSTESVGTPTKAEVLWESFGTDVTPTVGDLVNGVSLDNGYVKFTASDKKGNAVIAVKDVSGNILWSWHIWLTDQPEVQVYKNNAGTLMDRNLGATSATPGDVHALGLLFQWGRKDPFLGCSKIYDSSDPATTASSTLSWPSDVKTNSSNGTIAYAVAHPTTFIKCTINNYDWYYTGTFLTDNTRWQTTDKTKGMYDPCPAGWRVPDGGSNGVWSKAFGTSSYWQTSSNWDSTNKGMDFGKTDKTIGVGTIWYPAAGYRRDLGGSLYGVGDNGNYWSCTPNDYYAFLMYFNYDGYVFPSNYGNRASGLPVRCLSE